MLIRKIKLLKYFILLFCTALYANNPDILTDIAFNGNPSDSSVRNIPTVAEFKYDANDGNYTKNWTSLATAGETGAVWGMAYAKNSKKLYLSAVVRRHSGLKGGTGDIYVIDLNNSNSVSKFVTIPNTGTVSSNSDRNLADKNSPNHDPLFSEIAKVGLGDIDLSVDESTLYAVNLNEKALYKVDINSKKVTKVASINDPFSGCDDVRPWGLKITENTIYIGSVCADDLSKGAAISKLTDAGFSTVTTMDLTYDRELPSFTTDSSTDHHWHTWTDDISDVFYGNDNGISFPHYTQAILSDIEIDDDGSFILGFLDRSSLEGGKKNYSPKSDDDVLYNIMSGGDIRRICKINGSYVPEGESGCEYHNSIEDNKVEYYTGDYYKQEAGDDKGRMHRETTLGGLALYPGTGEVLSASNDPTLYDDGGSDYTGGVKTFNNSSGKHVRGKTVYDAISAQEGRARMGKAGGIGDVELLEEPSKTACIGDYVWDDENRDGLQDSTENGIKNITVKLLDENGTLISGKSTTTDDNGKYKFCNLKSGKYIVQFDKSSFPSSYVITSKDQGDDRIDSDIDKESGKSDLITLKEGINNYDIDMGLYKLKSSINVEKYTNGKDADNAADAPYIEVGDSVKWSYVISNTGEENLTGISLKDNKEGDINCPSQSLEVAKSMTCTLTGIASQGKYENMALVTAVDEDSNRVNDTDLSHYFGVKPQIDIEKSTNGEDADSGKGPEIEVGKNVTWEYKIKNTGNIKLSNINVNDNIEGNISCPKNTLDVNESMTCTLTSTAVEGQYENNATVIASDSNGVKVRDSDLSHYFGKVPDNASIGDYVWYDKNVNGIQDENEQGIENIRVHLYKDGVDTEINTTTDSNGKYIFNNLKAGNYQIKIDKPKNYPYFSPQNRGNDDSKDSDIDPSNGLSDSVTLNKNQHYRDLDAGLVCSCSSKIDIEKSTNGEDADTGTGPIIIVGSTVTWKYVIKNIGNSKLSDISVIDNKEGIINCPETELNASESMICTKTAIAIERQYENNVTVIAKDPLEHNITDSDLSHYNGVKLLCIGDYVWNDSNRDGIQNSNENPLAGIKVELLDENGDIAKDFYGNRVPAQYTNNNGKYKFCNLKKGDKFKIRVTPAETFTFSPKDQGGDDSKDSDINPDSNTSDIITLESDNMDIDAGLYREEICLGDYVWLDDNLNGIQDKNEPGVIAVKVTLSDLNGNSVVDANGNNVNSIKTNNAGYYEFCHLIPNKDYKIHFEVPASYDVTLKDKGSDLKDSDADLNGNIIVRNPSTTDLTKDMGIYCDCDDYLVHPDDYKTLKMPSLNIFGIITMFIIFIAFAKRD